MHSRSCWMRWRLQDILQYLHDLPAAVSSQTRLIADDCILYRSIGQFSDCETPQNDLDKLAQWGLTTSLGPEAMLAVH
jgi:hypothetical protein